MLDSTRIGCLLALVVALASTSLYPTESDVKRPLFLGFTGGYGQWAEQPGDEVVFAATGREVLKARVRSKLVAGLQESKFALFAGRQQIVVSHALTGIKLKTRKDSSTAVES